MSQAYLFIILFSIDGLKLGLNFKKFVSIQGCFCLNLILVSIILLISRPQFKNRIEKNSIYIFIKINNNFDTKICKRSRFKFNNQELKGEKQEKNSTGKPGNYLKHKSKKYSKLT
ncbi:hypothetical protein BpHYR1_003487 [Brachionus plicatilis]|uniref:Uncharacterized protein n=1 Tax=Brachionus plicatilis TaxID=10195 RepID=A0A3M7T0P7_BRAPC|nr:hypothetical protein BpHYR1_003487 [Brachionus plicatilis]